VGILTIDRTHFKNEGLMGLKIEYKDATQLQNTLIKSTFIIDDIDTGNTIQEYNFIFDVQDFSCVFDTEYIGMAELMFGPNKFQITDSYVAFYDGQGNQVADAKSLADYINSDVSQYSA
jgi:hypothetical protein